MPEGDINAGDMLKLGNVGDGSNLNANLFDKGNAISGSTLEGALANVIGGLFPGLKDAISANSKELFDKMSIGGGPLLPNLQTEKTFSDFNKSAQEASITNTMISGKNSKGMGK